MEQEKGIAFGLSPSGLFFSMLILKLFRESVLD
jgi:hypothetical protein